MTTLTEAIRLRHSVRSYADRPIAPAALERLQQEVAACNVEGRLHIQLVTDEKRAFAGLASYGKFRGVSNYLVMAGTKAADLDERIGYYGEYLVLMAQRLGLNSCWVGMTYRKVATAFTLAEGERLVCLIALGYGTTQGAPRRSKRVEQVSNATAETPEWFRRGVEAALLAPTAVNQQKFRFTYIAPAAPGQLPQVEARRQFSLVGYTRIDLGIARLHFELAAGRDRFAWA